MRPLSVILDSADLNYRMDVEERLGGLFSLCPSGDVSVSGVCKLWGTRFGCGWKAVFSPFLLGWGMYSAFLLGNLVPFFVTTLPTLCREIDGSFFHW